MAVFGAYSKYYNLLYRDKDYEGEVKYLQSLLSRFAGGETGSLMELGCGTGNHAFLFGRDGVAVYGVDQSADMIAEAKDRQARVGEHLKAQPEFHEGDVRNYRANRSFDAVCSLFHVVSYQNSNEDLLAEFQTARAHLEPGGLFIFDVWYGPAVLSDPPVVRVKRLADESTEVTRLAEPELHAERNIVDVNYEVIVKDRASGAVEAVKETHHMRYLFTPELEFFLKQAGFSEILHSEEWMTGDAPSTETWGVVFVARV
ncbi:MAG: class I SAM-dependent methyltransferase [bacterium]|nr:class I SAM-dependent methyltransferase [bacterium]